MAYNLFIGFKRLSCPESWVRQSIATFRWKMVQVAGRIVRHAGEIVLKLMIDLEHPIKKRIPIYGVLGNSDTVPTRIAPHLGLKPVNFSENIEMLHNKITEVKEFHFIGYHGRVKYLDENIVEAPELMFDEDKAAEDLSKLFENVDPRNTIFVTHVPPYGILDKVKEDWVAYAVSTYGDKAKQGHIGSNAFRNAALKYQPLVHTFGHVHETPGVEKKGRTTFINGGAFGEKAEVEEVTIKD